MQKLANFEEMVDVLRPLARIVLQNQHKCFKFKRNYSVHLPEMSNNDSTKKLKRSYSSEKSQELDQLGSWNTRINFTLSEEQSIRRGTPIPILSAAQVGIYSDRGRRLYQVSSSNTVWNFHNFSITQTIREINFAQSADFAFF